MPSPVTVVRFVACSADSICMLRGLDLTPITTWFKHVTVRLGLESRNSLERRLDRRSNSARRLGSRWGPTRRRRFSRYAVKNDRAAWSRGAWRVKTTPWALHCFSPAATAAPLGRGGDDGASITLTVGRRAGYPGTWHAGPRSMIKAS